MDGYMNRKAAQKWRSQSDGFTLVELLVVLGIIALLGALIAPQVIRYLSDARVESARVQLKNIESALELYYLDNGAYPAQDQGLQALVTLPPGVGSWRGPYLKNARGVVDPWGAAFSYRIPGEHGTFDLFSLGRDQAEGGSGESVDVLSW
jgi:general secretion pathway protein G